MAAASLEEMIACVDRELAMRAKTYPRYVKAKPPKLTQKAADLEMARLRAVRQALLEGEARRRLISQLAEQAVGESSFPAAVEAELMKVAAEHPEPQ